MYLEQVQVSAMAVFAYIVGDPDTGEALVIDPAANVDGLIRIARSRKLTIKTIVNTHGHVDHISGNLEMQQKTGAEIVIHEADAPMLVDTPPMLFRMFGAQSPATDRMRMSSPSAGSRGAYTRGFPAACALYRRPCLHRRHPFREAVGRADRHSWPPMLRSIRKLSRRRDPRPAGHNAEARRPPRSATDTTLPRLTGKGNRSAGAVKTPERTDRIEQNDPPD